VCGRWRWRAWYVHRRGAQRRTAAGAGPLLGEPSVAGRPSRGSPSRMERRRQGPQRRGRRRAGGHCTTVDAAGSSSADCGYLVDTWCLGVKNAIGPRRMSERELEAFRDVFFKPWHSTGGPAPLELGRHLVLGAADYARALGFAPHTDLTARGTRSARGRGRARSSSDAKASRATCKERTTTAITCRARSSCPPGEATSTSQCHS
jgi:hypothetical protein